MLKRLLPTLNSIKDKILEFAAFNTSIKLLGGRVWLDGE